MVNRSCLTRQVACRIRSIAPGKFESAFTANPFLVQSPELVLSEQILLGQAPSPTASASRNHTRFCSAASAAHIGLSDFLRLYIAVVLPWDSQRGPWRHLPRPDMGSPGSRAGRFRMCTRSYTTRGQNTPCGTGVSRFCLPIGLTSSTPRRLELSRLNTWPALPMELSSTTARRFLPVHQTSLIVSLILNKQHRI